MRLAITCMLALSVLSIPALANDNTSAAAILSQQAIIQADALKRSGRYKDVSETDLQALLEHQSLVANKLASVESTTQLSERDQITVFNSLEAIEAIINKAENERMVCERYKPIGTNRPTTVCKTVAQRRTEREAAEKSFQRDQQCSDGWGSGYCKN